jgi:5-methylcytosine-specific restriction endonuclease McrA
MAYKNKEDRDYARENRLYKSKPDQIAKRVVRNKARQDAIASGKAKVGDGTSVDHVVPLSKGGTNAKSNQRIVPVEANSSFSRNADHSVKKNVPSKRR